MARDDRVSTSSGNVFADLGLPEADERRAKAELARVIRQLLAQRGLTRAEAADLLDLHQPDVSDLVRGKLARFSRERIERFLIRLGMDVQIRVTPKRQRHRRARLMVEISA